MGYTMHQIDSCFNNIVEAYENMSFDKIPCSPISYYSPIYRSVALSKCNITVHISLAKHNQTLPGFYYPVQTLIISSYKYIGNHKAHVENYKKFYFIDSDYFTDDLLEVKSARDTSFKRHLSNHSLESYKILHIDLNKVSERLLSYLKNALSKRVGDCSYEIRDIYFRHGNTMKMYELVIVVKRSDKSHTEAVYFNPQLIPMYISGQLV